MLRIDIDDLMNSASNSCSSCCCEPISLRAGETRLITLNYAPWTIPIMSNGGPGLVPTPEISITEDTESCNNPVIDGFAAPTTKGLYFNIANATPVNTALTYDLNDDIEPSGNAFEYTLHPVSGPYHGALTASPIGGASWTYTPENGYVGYDQFWVAITDAQGRKIIRPVNINVGAATGIPPKGWGPSAAIGLQIDRSKMRINQSQQTITFPIYLPPSNAYDTLDACRRYRATVKAYARDCEETYSHITCIDVSSARC